MGLNNLRKISSKPIMSIDAFLAEKPDGVITATGFEFQNIKDKETKEIKTFGVFTVEELGGVKIRLTGSAFNQDTIPELLDEYKTEDGIDAGLKAQPLRFKLHPLKTKKQGGGFYRPLDYLGVARGDEV